jgi:L,D-transpeptidase ErfK/SrfK
VHVPAAALLAGVALAAGAPRLAEQVAGGSFSYAVVPGDSLTGVSARFGVDLAPLARRNGLAPDAWLRAGQQLEVESLHVVPSGLDEGVLINVPQRMLFHFEAGRLEAMHPVGLGRASWPTPLGEFRVGRLETDKTWIVPRSIQEEMRRRGEPVRTSVPPGPDNPLGRHWIGLAGSSCGIHGTLAPESVYRFQSHGCIRLHPDDVAALFAQVQVGTRVRLEYVPVLLARTGDGRLWLEVHRDVYGRDGDPLMQVEALAALHGLGPNLDWARVREVVAEAEGLAREVRARGAPEERP